MVTGHGKNTRGGSIGSLRRVEGPGFSGGTVEILDGEEKDFRRRRKERERNKVKEINEEGNQGG